MRGRRKKINCLTPVLATAFIRHFLLLLMQLEHRVKRNFRVFFPAKMFYFIIIFLGCLD